MARMMTIELTVLPTCTQGCRARRCPHSLALVCCFVAIFFAGFQHYGVSTVFTSLILSSFQLAPVYGIPFSLFSFGIPYALLSLPIAYLLGQKVGYKWTVISGQLLVYLYSLYNVLDCSLSNCVYKWQTRGISTPAFSLIFFCLSVPVLGLNLRLLALEQIPHESSETKSVCIHWMWLIFFLGRLTGAVVGSAIFWWTAPVFLFVIQLGMASTAMIIIIWAPLEKLIVGPYSLPFKTIWQVTREASKQLCNRRKREVRRRVDVPETYDPDYKPNAFERASHDFSGPLPTPDVRDVQKFYLILFMLVSLIGIWIMYSLVSEVMWMGPHQCLYCVSVVHACMSADTMCMHARLMYRDALHGTQTLCFNGSTYATEFAKCLIPNQLLALSIVLLITLVFAS